MSERFQCATKKPQPNIQNPKDSIICVTLYMWYLREVQRRYMIDTTVCMLRGV